MNETFPCALKDQSANTKLVYQTISIYEPVTYTELLRQLNISETGLTMALNNLQNLELITQDSSLSRDGRKKPYITK